MPIELWWWVAPLFYTGVLTVFVLGITAVALTESQKQLDFGHTHHTWLFADDRLWCHICGLVFGKHSRCDMEVADTGRRKSEKL